MINTQNRKKTIRKESGRRKKLELVVESK